MPLSNTTITYKEFLIKRYTYNYWYILMALCTFQLLFWLDPRHNPVIILQDLSVTWLCIAIIIFAGVPLYLLYKIFFDTIVGKISGDGLWTKKCGLFAWRDIWYVNVFEKRTRNDSNYYLNVRLKEGLIVNNYTEVKLHMPYYGRQRQQLLDALAVYVQQYNIEDLGKTVVRIDRSKNDLYY